MRRAIVAVAAASAAALVGAPAYAGAGVQHFAFSFDETATSHVDGLGRGCPAFTGTLLEQRHDDLAGVMLPDGTVHGRTDATSDVQLLPDEPAAVAYTGSYALHQTGTFLDDGETDAIVSSTVHATMSGSDGSSFRLTEVVHFSLGHDGTVRVSFDRPHCD